MTIREQNTIIDDMNNEDELTRCKNDIVYFVEKYVRLKTDDDDVPLHLTESQKNFLRNPQAYITKKFNHERRKRRINKTVQKEV